MSEAPWPNNDEAAPGNRRVAVVPRTPDYDHPYAQRIPKPPPIESEGLRRRNQRQTADPANLRVVVPRRNPAKFGIFLSLFSALMLCGLGYYVLSANYEATQSEAESIRQSLRQSSMPLAYAEETPADYVRSLDITSVRMAEGDSRASIDGEIFRVGEVINERHGLVFIGHDEKNENLLFRDAEKRVYPYRIHRE